MAQKTHPIAIRLNGVTPWKSLWYTSKNKLASEFIKQWSASCYIDRFYKRNGFDFIHFHSEKTNLGITYFIALRKIDDETGTKEEFLDEETEEDLYPIRFSDTLPTGLNHEESSFTNTKSSGDDEETSSNSTDANHTKLNVESTTNKVHLYPEFNVLLPGLFRLTGAKSTIIKSHPQFYINNTIPANFLATFIRDQLLMASKKKYRLVPLNYFREIALYLHSKLGIQLMGIKIQIKGRLPRLGSSGAARSSHQTYTAGELSLQKLTSRIDYDQVDLRTRSGLSSIKVWVSYAAPLLNKDNDVEDINLESSSPEFSNIDPTKELSNLMNIYKRF
jgi:hypothetical protein